MSFNSYFFILLFLPASVAGYFLVGRWGKKEAAHLYLTVVSLLFVFYGFNWTGLIALCVSVVLNYLFYKGLLSCSRGKVLLFAAVALNVASLFYLKYANTFGYYAAAALQRDFVERQLLLPLGISFYTFQQISFLVDAYRKEIPVCSFVDYCCYVCFYPRVLSGPIIRHEQFLPQLQQEENLRFNWDNFSTGLYRFAVGLGKKVLVADVLAVPANMVFSHPEAYIGINAVIGSLAFTLQLYFDFSGYCDMAVGIARMMNFTIPENFDSPYKALNIKDFWNRWHITLTQFLTKYVYIPLGGSKKGAVRTCLNILIVFLVSGLWHGSAHMEPFLVWGLAHGIASVVYRLFHRRIDRLHPAVNWAITFGYVSLAWIPFRAQSLETTKVMLRNMFAFGSLTPISGDLAGAFKLKEFAFLEQRFSLFSALSEHSWSYSVLFLTLALFVVLNARNAREQTDTFTASVFRSAATAALIGWSLISLTEIGTFIYAGF